MTTDSAAGRWRWRGEKPRSSAPSRSATVTKKWIGATVLSLLLMAVTAVMVWLCYWFIFQKQPSPTFVPFWISNYQRPQIAPIPGMERERSALQEAGVFPSVDSTEDPTWNSTLEVMKTRLDNLKGLKTGKGVVVYIAAYAMVSRAGDVQILAFDSDPYSGNTLLPLRTVLTRIKDCPERHKLLVLDIMKSAPYPFDVGGTPDGVADLIRNELQAQKDSEQLVDPNLLVLVACSPGQYGLWSESTHESIFGHFFREAFADPQADVINRNGAISVRELAAYVTDKVDRWAIQYRGMRQQPYLAGKAEDFELASLKPSPAGGQTKSAEREIPVAEGKAVEKEKAPEQGKIAAEPSDKLAAKEAAGPAAEKSASAAESLRSGYPEWLSKGWEIRQSWWQEKGKEDFPGAAAPRVFRRLEATLLRAEQEWRGGRDRQLLKDEFSPVLGELQVRMERAGKIPRPQVIRSVGQARAFGWEADRSLVAKLKNLVETQRTLGAAADPKPVEAAQKKAIDEILAALKTKPNPALDLAGTIVEATLDQRLDAGTITFLDSIVSESKVGRDVIELRLLRDLAQRAATPGSQGWSEEIVKLAWDTIGLAEKAGSRPRAFPWVRKILEQAQNGRHVAQVLLLSQARDFVSWEKVREVCDQVSKDFDFVTACQDRIEEAQTTLNRTRAMLPAYLPFLHATLRPNLENNWLSAAEATVVLDRLLLEPGGNDGSSSPAREDLEQLNNDLTAAIRNVKTSLEQLERPFQADNVSELLSQIESRPEPQTAVEIEALLTTPFLTVSDRSALWRGLGALDRKLGELPVRGDMTTAESEADDGRADIAHRQVARRAKQLAALLYLTGADAMAANLGGAVELNREVNALNRAPGKDEPSHTSDLAQNWAGLAKVAALVYDKLSQMMNQRGKLDGDDRVGWIAPAFLLSLDSSPTRQDRERRALSNWSWLAEHYRHQSHDLHEEQEPSQFYENAAQDCPGTGEPRSETSLAMSLPQSTIPTVSASQPSAAITVQIDAGAAAPDATQKVDLTSFQVDDPRLEVRPPDPAEVEVSPQKPATVTVRVAWDEAKGRPDTPPPKGFILQARLASKRSFHLLVPVHFEWKSIFPKIELSSTQDKLTEVPLDRFALRTLPGRQQFYAFVRNPSQTTPREVIVEVMAGREVIASSGAKALALPEKSTLPVPGFGPPPPKEGQPLPEAPADLQLRLRDGAPGGSQVYDVQPLAPRILLPEEYVQVTAAQFTPAGPGGENQLKVNLRALPAMTGPPCPVELVLPKDKELFPSLLGDPQGKLSGELEAGKDLTLTADAIKLGLGGSESGIFQLNIDGFKRSMWFRTNFVQVGGIQRAQEEQSPARVHFRTERIVKPKQPAQLRVTFEVDKVPPKATLAFNLGTQVGGRFDSDILFRDKSPKKRHIGFDPHGDGGALLFEAAIGDWEEIYDVPGIRGKRQARAFLLGARDQILAETGVIEIVLDDLPPQIVEMELPAEIEEGTPTLEGSCTVKPSASGVTDVDFVVDTKKASEADFIKADADGKITKGKMKDNDQRVWKARLPIPKDATGRLMITARATSGVGLTGTLSQAVAVRGKPAPPAADGAGKPPAKPGSIEGTVSEAGVPRGGFTVYLFDPKAKDPQKPVKEARTKDDGSFSFPEVTPGEYILICQNPETKRLDRPSVTVEAGAVTRKKLDLFLP
ncbi:MAG: carboxypeptidase-like regulatory domain-containing protein [Isosphaeraceae bacterium]